MLDCDWSSDVCSSDLAKVMSWYDNEIGYSQRLLDLARFVAERV
jgi:glyceraldehyde 3-phosphate dehydrogenase